MRVLTATVALTLAGVALAAVAHASQSTFHGKNGAIAFRRYFDPDRTRGAIFTVKADGTGERQVTHPPRNTVDDQPDWAPDGSLLAFERCVGNGPCALYTIRPDGRQLTRLSAPCPPGAKAPRCKDEWRAAFSPDGQLLAFASYSGGEGNEIVVMNRRGLGRRTVVPNDHVEFLDPQFSPDGRRILFVRHNFGAAMPKEGHALFVVDRDGGGLTRLTPWTLNAGDGPDWSPDGRWILFRSDAQRIKQSQIYLIHPDGTGLRRLTLFKEGTTLTSSSFSPDGKWIVFGATGVAGNADLFVMRRDGTKMRPVTRTKLWDSAPDWGPR